jgi:endonuclease-8
VPEGDTVWRTARSLDRALTGQTLVRTDFRVPRLASVDLSGRPVLGTVSRGKHLLTRIGDLHTLHSHLRMEGSWHLYRPGARWRRPAHEARAVLVTAEWTAVGFALGALDLVRRGEEAAVVGHLGPDLLGADWDHDEAVRRLSERPDRGLAEALLDQRCLAGIGNLYAAELCFLAGVSPTAPVSSVRDLPRLVRRARALLEANKDRVEQTTTGDLRHGRRTWVYRQRECRRCGTPVQVGTSGPPPFERVAYWCPSCQPGG